ncbi:phosphotransferase family protein [Streptomyces sp. NPDC058424]|uniref:phosphotransferase family protein n=1 Tax=Streptomyces sp. NPDC058424 TaxID=3346491 RepID=UPI0036608F6C
MCRALPLWGSPVPAPPRLAWFDPGREIGGVTLELDEKELLNRLAAAASSRWPGAEVEGLRRLPGGVSSLTYASTLHIPAESAQSVVVKVAPPGLAPVRNRDVLRQARVIRALDAVPVMRVPSVLFEDDGAPPLFAMELVPGDSYEPLLDVMPDPPTAEVVGRRARAAARMLARMQSLSPESLGLADEPVVTVKEELDRWALLLDTVDDDICPGHRELYDALAERVPNPVTPVLVHGDYRLANMLFLGDALNAVIDWEIWSVGDPRTDLAWLLMHTDPVHHFEEARDEADRAAGRGMPTRLELLEEYQRVRPVPMPELDWFLAYCHYKTASTVSVFVKRNRRRPDPDPKLVTAAASLVSVIRRGREILESAGPS